MSDTDKQQTKPCPHGYMNPEKNCIPCSTDHIVIIFKLDDNGNLIPPKYWN